MSTSPKDQITTAQVAVIVINYTIGTGILTLPRASAEKVQTPDIWLTVIVGGLIAMIAGVIIVRLSQSFPGKTFYQYSQTIVGKWLGGLLSLLLVCYFVIMSGFHARSLVEVTSSYLLVGTPSWAIVMPFMWVSLYLIMGGINPLARLFEIIIPITAGIFLVVAFLSFKTFEVDNLRPVLGLGIVPVLKGIKTTALSYTGFESMLIIIAFMKQPNKAVKAVLVGIFIPLIFYLITVVMVIGTLSVDGLITLTWPTLDLIRSFEMPGLLFERFESLLLAIWIMKMFTCFSFGYYAASLGLSQLFQKNIHPFMYGLLPIIYIIAMTPKSINEVFKLGDMMGNFALFLFGLQPLLLLLVLRLKKRKHEVKV